MLQKKLNINLYNYKIFSGKYIEYDTNGNGKEYYNNANWKFEGEYLNGERNGKGKEYDEYGILRFEGEYLNGKIWNGKGSDEINNNTYELKDINSFTKEYYENDILFFLKLNI